MTKRDLEDVLRDWTFGCGCELRYVDGLPTLVHGDHQPQTVRTLQHIIAEMEKADYATRTSYWQDQLADLVANLRVDASPQTAG
jgi:hypothetical protein